MASADDTWKPADPETHSEWVLLETCPENYRHLQLEVDGPIATVCLNIQEDEGHRPDYQLKLNSYDMSVDIELADVVQRLRFEHPQVSCVVLTSALDGVFSAGANIFMLRSASHAFKVNFCKYTNETRLAIEDATAHSGQTWIAALNGISSGGGYELPLACEEIYLVDDRRSAVSLPEVPNLGVLPGTGGLTRLVDKRRVRRDRADIFTTVSEGIKGRRAAEWGLVDGVFRSSQFEERIAERAREIAADGHSERVGIALDALQPTVEDDGVHYRHVDLTFGPVSRTATLTLRFPTGLGSDAEPVARGVLRMWRELDDAILRLRFHYRDVGLILLQTRGEIGDVLAADSILADARDQWLVHEVLLLAKRVLKRLDLTSKSIFALIDAGSCFGGSLLELALAADRSYMFFEDVEIAVSPLNAGVLPMSNGLSRLHSRFFGNAPHADALLTECSRYDADAADDAGLVTANFDDIDWEDELRMIIEERASYSPDALTGMEASLRFVGPETLETKIFGRLSAWQNWIFYRPNSTGSTGALTLFGEPGNPAFDWERT